MAKALDFHPKALEEALTAVRWYAERSRQAADELLTEIQNAIDAVSSAPERYPNFIAGTRRFLLKRFPFSLVYHDGPSLIEIVAVAHSRRRPGYWKDRLR